MIAAAAELTIPFASARSIVTSVPPPARRPPGRGCPLGPDGPDRTVDIDPARRPARDAAVDHLRLLVERPDRVRRCAHPACVLYFLDTSRNGTRRWCSMETCGNRAKAGRHYARARGRT